MDEHDDVMLGDLYDKLEEYNAGELMLAAEDEAGDILSLTVVAKDDNAREIKALLDDREALWELLRAVRINMPLHYMELSLDLRMKVPVDVQER